MNKWQQAYSELKEWQDNLRSAKVVNGAVWCVVSVLLMLVEDKIHE